MQGCKLIKSCLWAREFHGFIKKLGHLIFAALYIFQKKVGLSIQFVVDLNCIDNAKNLDRAMGCLYDITNTN
jgi:hypothetical protein